MYVLKFIYWFFNIFLLIKNLRLQLISRELKSLKLRIITFLCYVNILNITLYFLYFASVSKYKIQKIKNIIYKNRKKIFFVYKLTLDIINIIINKNMKFEYFNFKIKERERKLFIKHIQKWRHNIYW